MKDVQLFVGFANFYCHFLQNFLIVIRPIIELTHKNTSIVWSLAYSNTF